MEIVLRELRLASRRLLANRAFSAAAVTSLALAIALSTTMFGSIDAVLRPSLPIYQPDHLFSVTFGTPHPPAAIDADRYRALRASSHLFSGVAAMGPPAVGTSVAIQSSRGDASAEAVGVTGSYFDVLGERAAQGRLFTDSREDLSERAAVISHALWVELGGGPHDFRPFTALLNGQVFNIVGVLPSGGQFPREVDVFVLVSDDRAAGRYLLRVSSGTTSRQLEGDLRVFAARFGTPVAGGMHGQPLRYRIEPAITSPARLDGTYAVLMLAAVTVLLLACGNIANVQAARGLARRDELAVRASLGASRQKLMIHLFAESLLISGVGGLLGLLLSWCAVSLLRTIVPPSVGWLSLTAPQMSWRVGFFCVLVTGVTSLLVGAAPTLRLSRQDPSVWLSASRGSSQTERMRRYNSVLVVTEIAGALMLLAVASLLIETARRVDAIDLGYDPHNLLVAGVRLRSTRDSIDAMVASARAAGMLARLSNMPDVVNVARAFWAAPARNVVAYSDPSNSTSEIRLPRATVRLVSPDFLRTLRLPITQGHDFGPAEKGAVAEAILDEVTAERFWPGLDPIGRMIKLGDTESQRPWLRVVGVVRRPIFLVQDCIAADCSWPVIFVDDVNLAAYGDDVFRFAQFVIRVKSQPAHTEEKLRRGGWLDSPQTFFTINQWGQITGIDALRESHHFVATAFTTFGLFGLALAMIGIYGVVSHAVTRRAPEFGIRIALGATSGEILRLVLWEGNLLALLGLAVGLILAVWTTRLITSFLYGVDHLTPLFFAAAVIGTYAAVLLASLTPALRATRVSPMDTLRKE